MTKEEYINKIEHSIELCNELGGMEKEKWAFIQCLKFARKLNDNPLEKNEVKHRCKFYSNRSHCMDYLNDKKECLKCPHFIT
jgi:hypothetical protein